MTSALYLEHYLDSKYAIYYAKFFLIIYIQGLEHLPIELQRNFKLMRDLDTRAQSLMKNIDSQADEHLRNQKTLSADQKKEQLDKIQGLFNKAKVLHHPPTYSILALYLFQEYGDDKVQLAIQTYELVDKHIRRLDNDLARFESEIQDKALNSRNQEEPVVGKSNFLIYISTKLFTKYHCRR